MEVNLLVTWNKYIGIIDALSISIPQVGYFDLLGQECYHVLESGTGWAPLVAQMLS